MNRDRSSNLTILFVGQLLVSTPLWAVGDNMQALSESNDELLLFFEEKDLVSIATGNLQPKSKAPAVASVITADDIKAMGISELSQILEMVPGLHVYPNTNARLDNQYSIRGIHTTLNAQVLMLLNGTPISSPATSSRLPNFRYPVANIARVEVIRGPGSALYGADAYSGVINIITKDVEYIDGARFGWRQGSFNSQDMWLQQSVRFSAWDFVFSVESSRTDGDPGREVDDDGQSIFMQPSYAPGPLSTYYDVTNTHINLKNSDWSFEVWNWRLVEAGVGQGAAQVLDPEGKDKIDNYFLDIERDWGESKQGWRFSNKLVYSYADVSSHFVLFPPGAVVPVGNDGNLLTGTNLVTFPDGVIGNPGGKVERHRLEFNLENKKIENHSLRLGYGVEYMDLTAREEKNFGPGVIDGTEGVVDGALTDVTGTKYAYAPDKSRTLNYLLLQDEWVLNERVTLTTGLRYDSYNDFGDTTNPRLALVYAPAQSALTSKLLYGKAFRAPSMNELYYRNNPSSVGNPDVKPEEIDTIELVFDHKSTSNLTNVLSLYKYQAKGLIGKQATAQGQLSTNATDQDGHGFELESTLKANENLMLRAFYAWQHAENVDTGERVADAPKEQFYLSATWRFMRDWSWNGQAKWIGDRVRVETDTRDQIDDYTLVNMTLRKENIFLGSELALIVRNVFDEDAREPSAHVPNLPEDAAFVDDLPLEGRSVFAELSYHF